jgi:YD repeat-containing protein
MPKEFIKAASVAIALVAAFIMVTAGAALADKKKGGTNPDPGGCFESYRRCCNIATFAGGTGPCPEHCGQTALACVAKQPASSYTFAPPTNPTSNGKIHHPPVNLGGVNQPVGGGTSQPTGKGGKFPVNLGGVKLPIEGSSNPTPPPGGNSSGATVYDKSGTGKPIVTTSPTGLTTTTVYDKYGNSISTVTDSKGKLLGKTKTFKITPTGMTLSQTTDGKGNLISTTTATPNNKGGYISETRDKNRKLLSKTIYDNTGKVVSQKGKIKTLSTGTGANFTNGKGHRKVFLEEGSQKHKEKITNQVFREEKLKLNDKDWAATSGSSSSGQSQRHARHR